MVGEQKDRTDNPRDRGDGPVAYLAVLLLVAAVVAAVASSGLPGKVTGYIGAAACRVAVGDCGTAATAATAARREPGSPVPTGYAALPPMASPSTSPPSEEQVAERERRQAQAETEGLLGRTQLGRDALEWARANHVQVRYSTMPGGFFGSSYDPDFDDGIKLKYDQPQVDTANSFVYEVEYAKHRGTYPDPTKMSRRAYLDKYWGISAAGHAAAIRNNQQLQSAKPGQVPDFQWQPEYEAAYRQAVDAENRSRITTGRPVLSAEEARRTGESAGQERLKELYKSRPEPKGWDLSGWRTDAPGRVWDEMRKQKLDQCFFRIRWFC